MKDSQIKLLAKTSFFHLFGFPKDVVMNKSILYRGANGSDIIQLYLDSYSDNNRYGYSDTIFLDMNKDTNIFFTDTNTNTIFNLELDTDTNTDNYPDLNIFEIRIFG
jgi:hypothetical protein